MDSNQAAYTARLCKQRSVRGAISGLKRKAEQDDPPEQRAAGENVSEEKQNISAEICAALEEGGLNLASQIKVDMRSIRDLNKRCTHFCSYCGAHIFHCFSAYLHIYCKEPWRLRNMCMETGCKSISAEAAVRPVQTITTVTLKSPVRPWRLVPPAGF